MRRVLCVSAHPDDAELGAGGTLAKHAAAGDEVAILVLGTGATARKGATAGDVEALRAQCSESAKILGVHCVNVLRFQDQQFDAVPFLEIVQSIEAAVRTVRPQIVYSHHVNDLNLDHRIAGLATRTACRPGSDGAPTEHYAFEAVSSSEWGDGFKPTVFEPLADLWLDRKLAALSCFTGEMRELPHPRSAEGVKRLAQWRGVTACVDAAEAFEVVRIVR